MADSNFLFDKKIEKQVFSFRRPFIYALGSVRVCLLVNEVVPFSTIHLLNVNKNFRNIFLCRTNYI